MRLRPALLDNQIAQCSASYGRFQPSQLHSARPIIRSLSLSERKGSSSVNMVMHWRQVQGMRVMSVPQNIRSGPKAS